MWHAADWYPLLCHGWELRTPLGKTVLLFNLVCLHLLQQLYRLKDSGVGERIINSRSLAAGHYQASLSHQAQMLRHISLAEL